MHTHVCVHECKTEPFGRKNTCVSHVSPEAVQAEEGPWPWLVDGTRGP